MADFFLAPVLAANRAYLNRLFPNRDKTSDGWVGDTSHAARASDHNPDWDSGGIVRATDTDKDGLPDPMAVVLAMIVHPSTNYVIFNHFIWSRVRGFRRAAYTGSNPHDKHIHWSILHSAAAANSTVLLDLEDDMPTAQEVADAVWAKVLPKRGDIGPAQAQEWLTHAAFVATTAPAAVLAMLRSEGISGAGDVGRMGAGLTPFIKSAVASQTAALAELIAADDGNSLSEDDVRRVAEAIQRLDADAVAAKLTVVADTDV